MRNRFAPPSRKILVETVLLAPRVLRRECRRSLLGHRKRYVQAQGTKKTSKGGRQEAATCLTPPPGFSRAGEWAGFMFNSSTAGTSFVFLCPTPRHRRLHRAHRGSPWPYGFTEAGGLPDHSAHNVNSPHNTSIFRRTPCSGRYPRPDRVDAREW